jgi:hypothetical protein
VTVLLLLATIFLILRKNRQKIFSKHSRKLALLFPFKNGGSWYYFQAVFYAVYFLRILGAVQAKRSSSDSNYRRLFLFKL